MSGYLSQVYSQHNKSFNRCILTYEHAYFKCFLVRKPMALVMKENLYALPEDL